MNDIDLAKAAAFIDGEGNIGLHKHASRYGRPQYRIVIQLENTNRKIVDFMHTLFGGGLLDSPARRNRPYKQRPAWQWRVGSREDVTAVLRAVRPYLIAKGPQAWLALEFDAQCPASAGGKLTSPEDVALREGFYQTMKNLNAGEAGI